jgi:hypothetical protein
MTDLGKILLGMGLLLALIGTLLLIAGRTGLPHGRLPGDFAYQSKNISVFIPLGTCLLLSVILSVLFYILSRFRH